MSSGVEGGSGVGVNPSGGCGFKERGLPEGLSPSPFLARSTPPQMIREQHPSPTPDQISAHSGLS